MMKRLLLAGSVIVLVACTDTTGVSTTSTKPPHPKSNANAAVTVVEFADLQCPACRAAHTVILKPLIASHGASIRYEFKHFPIASLHRHAIIAAQASECAADQQKFWEFVDMDYERQDKLSPEMLSSWAKELNLNMDLFDRCMKSGIKKDIALADYDEGKAKGVKGTPTFFVNGERVESELPKIQAAIDAALKGMGQRL
jgi:protein-disulfide isomerase